MIYLSLFFVAFLSGSILPLGSEALLIYDIKSGNSLTLLIIVATIGNVLGAILNYYLGIKGERFLLNRGYISTKTLKNAKIRFNKYGGYSLLLASMPIIGDPLTFIAGVMEYNFKKFLIFVTISKLVRYIIVATITMGYL